jgi:hypothetical protein
MYTTRIGNNNIIFKDSLFSIESRTEFLCSIAIFDLVLKTVSHDFSMNFLVIICTTV